MKMCLGAQLYTVRDYMKTEADYRMMMKKIAEIGYKTVQMSGYNTAEITPAVIKEVTEENNLKVVLTHTAWDRIKNETEQVIEEHNLFNCDAIGIGGYHGDCAATFACGEISDEAKRLIEVTEQSFYEGLRYAKEGCRVSDISAAVQRYVEKEGFSIVREYVGHGIGRNLHEAPEVPNYGEPGRGPRLLRGMTLAVEPMVNAGTAAIQNMSDGWTVKTKDGKYSAHYENTILITEGDPELLTDPKKVELV